MFELGVETRRQTDTVITRAEAVAKLEKKKAKGQNMSLDVFAQTTVHFFTSQSKVWTLQEMIMRFGVVGSLSPSAFTATQRAAAITCPGCC